jgi:pimeloyl-ACP methyl ester carboxylesterase
MTAEKTPAPAAPDTIVLIHGLWVTPRSWEKWVEHYEGRGYRVLAPAYPGFEVEVEALNQDPTPIEASTIPAVVEHLEGIVGGLERAPIIMGHSAGGCFTQILLDRGYGAAGVAIDSAPTEGVSVTPVSQIRSLFPILKPGKPPQGGGLHPRAVPPRLHHHPKPGGVGQGLPALPHPSAWRLRVGQGPGQLHARSPGSLRQLQKRRPGAVALQSGWRRQPHASSGQPIERQALLPHQLGH